MTPCSRRSTIIALITCMALPAWGEQYLLYSPHPVTPGQSATLQEGILVREIEIQNGDTLSALSRKFSGRAMYFPQILLFNSIKNPDLIYSGSTLKVPVTQKKAHDSGRTGATSTAASRKPIASVNKKSTLRKESSPALRQPTASPPVSAPTLDLSLSELKKVGTGKSGAKRQSKKSAVHGKRTLSHGSPAETSHPSLPQVDGKKAPAAAGQKLFEAAVKAYRRDDCRTALELLDRYLADNPGSPLAADANLYKADCYLKLSAQ